MLPCRPALRTRLARLFVLLSLGLASSPAWAQGSQDVVERARQAASTNDNNEAARLFEQAIASSPERRGELLLEYADQLAFSGRPAEAVPLYRERLADSGLDPATRQRAGRSLAFALLWSSGFQEAVAAWESILRGSPGDAEARKALSDALVGLARQAAERSRSADAAALFGRAIGTAPGRRQELLPEYAEQTSYAGQPAGAAPLYREALRDGSRPEDQQRRLRRGLAFALLWSGQFREAAGAFEDVVRQDPNDAQARQGLADARAGTERQPAPAGPSAGPPLGPPAAAQPASPADAAIAAAREAAGRGANKEAALLFERAIGLNPGRRGEVAVGTRGGAL